MLFLFPLIFSLMLVHTTSFGLSGVKLPDLQTLQERFSTLNIHNIIIMDPLVEALANERCKPEHIISIVENHINAMKICIKRSETTHTVTLDEKVLEGKDLVNYLESIVDADRPLIYYHLLKEYPAVLKVTAQKGNFQCLKNSPARYALSKKR